MDTDVIELESELNESKSTEYRNTITFGKDKYYIILYRATQQSVIDLTLKSTFYLKVKESAYLNLLYPKSKIPIRDFDDFV